MLKKANKIKIVLASASPRRRQLLRVLLKNFGLKFVVKPSNIVEYIPQNTANLGKIVTDLSYQKAAETAKKYKGLVIAADTIVVIGKNILGKPSSRAEAVKMLKSLSGKTHIVYTGICMLNTSNEKVFKTFEKTKVTFRKLSVSEINFYVKGGSPMDKAGAYGIQDDFGSTFVERIDGDYFNVVGLPIVKTYIGLNKMLGIMPGAGN